MSKKAVFFDRDGTLNRSNILGNKSHAPTSFQDFELLPESVNVTKALKKSGFLVFVITNQPTISTGVLSISELEKMNTYTAKTLNIDHVYYCPHTETDSCNCRKPKSGMLIVASKEHNLDLSKSWMVGDTWRDVQAGKAAGCKTILLKRDWSESEKCEPDYIVKGNLGKVLDIILQRSRI